MYTYRLNFKSKKYIIFKYLVDVMLRNILGIQYVFIGVDMLKLLNYINVPSYKVLKLFKY